MSLHKSAQAIKDFGEQIPSGHHLEDSSLHDEEGFRACAFRYQHPFRTVSRCFPFYPEERALRKNHPRNFPSARRTCIVLRSIAGTSVLWATRRRPRPIIGIQPNAFCGDKLANSTQRSLTKSTTKLKGSPGGVLDSNCGIEQLFPTTAETFAGALALVKLFPVAWVRWGRVALSIITSSFTSASYAPWRRRFFDYDWPQPGQRDSRITLQKFPRWKCGSLSARTSALTLPKVVSGLCLIPS